MINQAVLSAQGQYVNLPSGLLGEHTAVSLEVWATFGLNSGWPTVFEFGELFNVATDANALMVRRYDDSGNIGLWWNDKQYKTSVPFNGQTMHGVVTLAQGDFPRLYINGVLSNSNEGLMGVLPPSTVFYLGKSFAGQPSLMGSVDEFRVWEGVLSASEVRRHYLQGPGMGC